MKIDIIRDTFTDVSTIGKLYIDNEYHCNTLEDKYREVEGKPVSSWKVDKQTAIPCGTYDIVLDMSTRWHKIMPHILGVEGFTGVRIHSGNDANDTEGCPLVGATRFNDGIADCHEVYASLVSEMAIATKNKESIKITISNREV